MQKNVERHWSERVGFLGPDKCLTGQIHLDLCNLPRDSNDEDRLPIYKEGIRTWKYIREKLLPPH